MSEDLSLYLLPRGRVPTIGAEKGPARAPSSGIARYRSPHGSDRFVLYQDGRAISVLQVVTLDGKSATIANVYTLPGERRRRHAATLLAEARRRYASVVHSTHLSEDGRRWSEAVRDRARKWRRRR